jgi:hypothetical protein
MTIRNKLLSPKESARAAAGSLVFRKEEPEPNQTLERNAYARPVLFFFATRYGVAHL